MLLRETTLPEAASRLRRGGSVGGLPDGGIYWLLANAIEPPTWIIVPGQEEADAMVRGLTFHLERQRAGPRPAAVLLYPHDHLPPYSGVSPTPRAVRERLAALDALGRGERVLVVAAAEALALRVLTPALLASRTMSIRRGDEAPRRRLLEALSGVGYLSTVHVTEPGCYAVRGGILDIWPGDRRGPVRLDFFDDEVDSIRELDPDTQRSGSNLSELRILPVKEWFPDEEGAVERLQARTRAALDGDRDAALLRRRVVQGLGSRLGFSAVEDWLPALYPVTLPLEHGGGAVVVDPQQVALALRDLEETAARRHEELLPDERPLVPPRERYASADEIMKALDGAGKVLPLALEDALDPGFRDNSLFQVRHGDLAPIVESLRHWLEEGWQVGLAALDGPDADRLIGLLEPYDLPLEEVEHHDPDELSRGRISVMRGDLPRGFHSPSHLLALISTSELFAERQRSGTRRHPAFRRTERVGPGQLREGTVVVHAYHGIGRFRTMARLEVAGVDTDFLRLEYANGDLYLPVHKLDLVSRYKGSSADKEPRLDRMGGQTWQKRQQRVKDFMVHTAHELLGLYARRGVAEARACPPPGDLYRRFAAAFSFDETPDQLKAIQEVEQDLERTRPMDRLVVGDVGYGKTEVAMRAAARMVEAGGQVAILCPTTVLAYQHMETFKERFSGFDIKVGMLSRLSTPAETRAVLAGLREGTVQIVVGTTRLLARTTRFTSLGLLVVDEEHRFGVRQKEHIKRLRADVHVLSLSATPIPRSLSMALSGVRDFSVIATPPEERLAVRTRIARFSDDAIRDEVQRELDREGQVFFVHNRVRSIDAMARYVQRLFPEARICVTHGQMAAVDLERALVSFVSKQADILVTTSIIESGVDLPNVNCVVVNRADQFGMAQLYQVRGRVGRSWRRGRCLLLVPADQDLSRKATRRLRVLLEHQDLGAGFAVANADMEQRGAGTILGENQHGHVDAVGLDTYVELMEQVLAEARGDLQRKRLDPEVEIPGAAYIPESMLPGVEERLEEYRHLAGAENPTQLRAVLSAMEEQFGELPLEMLNLGWLMEARLRCRPLGIARLSWLRVQVELELDVTEAPAHGELARLAERHPNRFTHVDEGRFRVRFTQEEAEYPYRFVQWLLKTIEGGARAPARRR